jgi:hypothetical protein
MPEFRLSFAAAAVIVAHVIGVRIVLGWYLARAARRMQ